MCGLFIPHYSVQTIHFSLQCADYLFLITVFRPFISHYSAQTIYYAWVGMALNTSTTGWYWSDSTYPQWMFWQGAVKAGCGAGQGLTMLPSADWSLSSTPVQAYKQPWICETWPGIYKNYLMKYRKVPYKFSNKS